MRGLTMLHIRYGDGLGVAKAAVPYGATLWMTPWGTGSGGSAGGADTTTEVNPNGCKGSIPVVLATFSRPCVMRRAR